MAAKEIRTDYEQLNQIAKKWKAYSESINSLQSELNHKVNILRNGDWIGKSAENFYAEMDSSVFPALERLASAFDYASKITLSIARIMHDAEIETALLWRNEITLHFGDQLSARKGGDYLFKPISMTNLGVIPSEEPPPVPVPRGGQDNGWKWNPDPNNKRGGTWGPQKPVEGGSGQPSASWDPDGHWDVDSGTRKDRKRYDDKGNPLTPDEAHKKSSISPDLIKKIEIATGLTGAALLIYIIISEGSRFFPPRNLIPIP